MKVRISLLIVCIVVFFSFSRVSAQYVQTYFDYILLQKAENHVHQLVDAENKEQVFHMLALLNNSWWLYDDDPQASYIAYHLQAILEQAMQSILDKQFGAMGDDIVIPSLLERIEEQAYIDDKNSNSVEDENVWDISQVHAEENYDEFWEQNELLDQFTQLSRRQFYEAYFPHMLVDRLPPDRCFTYYDKIDQIAQARNFPTALIIATWHREHTCNFANPGNWWWNFQITSHYYPPGDITWDDLQYQIENFIDFTEAKWRWYDAIQVYGPEPVEIAYDQFDLASIRKSAILYNGVYPNVRLDYSRYANENFTQERGWRNGIVASVLQVLRWEFEQWILDE